MPRIAACHLCKVLVKFPDVPPDTPKVPATMRYKSGEEFTYKDDDGHPVMVAKYDPMLEDFVERHDHNLEDSTFLREGVIEVISVEPKTWRSMDVMAMIREQIHQRTQQWYEDRDTYRIAATECYNAHGNPDLSTGCPDYLSDSKRIGNAVYEEDGHKVEIPAKFRQYLCYQCPYQQAYVNVEVRRRNGWYRL